MNLQTVYTFINHLKNLSETQMTRNDYCTQNNLSKNYFTNKIRQIKKEIENGKITGKVVDEFNEIINQVKLSDYKDDSATIVRDENGRIKWYSFRICRKNHNPIVGKITRDEMDMICRLYTYKGQGLTAKDTSTLFPEYEFSDFKRILKVFNIYKADSPIAPHQVEEHTPEELKQIYYRNKEHDFMLAIEGERNKYNESQLRKFKIENENLKQKLDQLDNIELKVQYKTPITPASQHFNTSNEIILYIADMHIGAKVSSNGRYSENINYGEQEVNRRLDEIVKRVSELGTFDTIHICLMGDNMDSVGINNKTVSQTHSLPENMDGFEQLEAYLNVMHRFVNNIYKLCNNIKMYSVRDGNHTGVFEYTANRALFGELKNNYNIPCELYKEFFGVMKVKHNVFVLSHGKDAPFAKKGMPLNLDDRTKNIIYEWLDSKGIHGHNIHIVKGDLHSDSLNACYKFDYRNVLSLFGASDHSAVNYNRNAYGMSYDMFIGNTLVRGTFTNV